jgi:glycosyltransferase involved in cell wall biosynthesis
MAVSSLMSETPVREVNAGCLRVAIVTNYPSHPGRIVGGVQAVSARLVEALAAVPGLELHVIHCHSDIAESRVVQQSQIPNRGGPVTLHFIAQTRRRVVPNMITSLGLIGERLRQIAPDVVHAHGPHLAVASLRAGYQPLWTIHGVLREEAPHFPSLFHRLSFALAQHYERQALGRVGIITAVSPYVVEVYRGRSQARWEVIENPADAAYFELPRRPVRGRVLVPGAVIPRKDQLTLVRAAAQVCRAVPQLSLHLAGSLSNAAYVAELRDEIGHSGLTETVRLLGPLPTDRLLAEFSQAEVVALASRQESAPMAVIEALAAGVPVVATAAGGVPYLVEDGVTGRVVPQSDSLRQADPAALAEALIEVLSRPAKAAAMGAAGRAVAQNRFRPEQVAGQYLALYREMVLSAPRPEGF